MKPGNKYKFTLKDKEIEGLLVNATKTTAFVKLKSGYNIGIKLTNIKSFKQLPKEKIKTVSKPVKHNKSLKNILILHTGGTIASKVDYSTGAVSNKFTPEEILALFPELQTIANVDSKLIQNISSDDMNFSHYNTIIKEIQKSKADGIILTQGTDTMHYTAAALSFMIENPSIPIILVGSQRSSDRPSSDASSNLLNAATFITKSDFKGVAICMHSTTNDPTSDILQGTNARKMHSSKRDAFKSINNKLLASVNYEKKEVKKLREYPVSNNKTKYTQIKDLKIGLLKTRPNLQPEEIKTYESFDGLILEGTGLGHFPIGTFDKSTEKNKLILESIKKIAKNKVVAMTTQCINGKVNLNVYSPGRTLKDLGVLGHNLDMTSETAYIKLAWVLSNYTKEKAKELYSKNLRGEISERIEENLDE